MANNRMFLVNDRLDSRVSIAKFYPGGWTCGDGVSNLLNGSFAEGNDYTMYGNTDWRFEYETVTDLNGDAP
jgi:hypothetical protein